MRLKYMSDIIADSNRLIQNGLCIGFVSIKKHRNDLAKFGIINSSEFGLLIPSHLSPGTFTISTFNNFDHMDKNMLSGKSSSHDTVYFKKLLLRKKWNLTEVR